MKAQGRLSLGRRQFFRALAAGTAASVAGPLARGAAADTENRDEKRKPRYRESD